MAKFRGDCARTGLGAGANALLEVMKLGSLYTPVWVQGV